MSDPVFTDDEFWVLMDAIARLSCEYEDCDDPEHSAKGLALLDDVLVKVKTLAGRRAGG
jgi:hypothetical protein